MREWQLMTTPCQVKGGSHAMQCNMECLFEKLRFYTRHCKSFMCKCRTQRAYVMSRNHHRPSNAEPLSIEGTQMLWSCSLIEMPPDDCSATDHWPIKRLADLLRLWKMP